MKVKATRKNGAVTAVITCENDEESCTLGTFLGMQSPIYTKFLLEEATKPPFNIPYAAGLTHDKVHACGYALFDEIDEALAGRREVQGE